MSDGTVIAESHGPALRLVELPVRTLLYVHGRAVTLFQPSGGSRQIELVSTQGKVEDLCVTLA
jgi:hypothetical protein